MKLNAFFPTRDIGTDPAQDPRLGAGGGGSRLRRHRGRRSRVRRDRARRLDAALQRNRSAFHETFTTLAFLAAVTKTIKLSSGILILPQRQTGLVAKQAAEVDILSGGCASGSASGWNHVEYASLGMDWKTRGARQAEQVEVLRRLWTEDLVTFKGRFHDLREVSIVPPPIQRPIPIWFGGSSDAVMKRAARLGDGWMPIMAPGDEAAAKLAALREHLKAFGRDPAAFGLEAWLRMDKPDPQIWGAAAAGWQKLGVGMVMLYPMYRIASFDAQIDTLRRFKEVAGG